MTKQKQITIKMTPNQAAAVMLALIESQQGYTDGPTTPERIINLREVITSLDLAMEELVSNSI
jgi:hypothetical protein